MPRLTPAKRNELQKKFAEFDKSGKKMLTFSDMKSLLLRGNAGLKDPQLKVLFKRVDTNGDGLIDFDEFVAYLYCSEKVVVAAPAPVLEKFREFCKQEEMDQTEFIKFCEDCLLLGKNFKKEEIAGVFAQAIGTATRKLSLQRGDDGFSQLDRVLCLIAERKKVAPAEVHRLVSEGRRSEPVGTSALATTLTQKRGRLDTGKSEPQERFDVGSDGTWLHLVEEKFQLFDKEQNGLDGREFAKLLEDSSLLDSSFTKGEADVMFTKLRTKRLPYEGFLEVLKQVAEKRREPLSEVQLAVAKCRGPTVNATPLVPKVRAHDEKSPQAAGLQAAK